MLYEWMHDHIFLVFFLKKKTQYVMYMKK